MINYGSLGYKTIDVRVDDRVGIVTLNRPQAMNAWTEEMRSELIDVYEKMEKDDRVRVIILTADPAKSKAFCAGADLSLGDFSRSGVDATPGQAETEHRDGGGRFVLTTLRSRKITIAAINGHAAGVGITQTLGMDIRFAWQEAKIIFPFVRRGILPEATSSYLLPRLIGRSRALAVFLLSSNSLPACSPLLSGLFADLLPTREDVFPTALRVAHDLAYNTSPRSVAFTKALVLHGTDSADAQHLLDSRAMFVLGNGNDGKEGVRAFVQKREPRFEMGLGELPAWLPGQDRLRMVWEKAEGAKEGVKEKAGEAVEGSKEAVEVAKEKVGETVEGIKGWVRSKM